MNKKGCGHNFWRNLRADGFDCNIGGSFSLNLGLFIV